MKKLEEPLVSIVTPSYNAEKYISETINSVLKQDYQNFEMLIVDDRSTDNTCKIVKDYAKKDKRIKLFILPEKGGASEARNKAIREAKGKYVAFLDSDDLWKPEKLKKQIRFMEDNNIDFSYTDYEYMNEAGVLLNKKRVSPKKISYFQMLLGDTIGCLTVVYNAKKTGIIQIPKLDKRNDYALWCLVLKKLKVGYKYDEILAVYRKGNASISSGSKVKLLKYHYQLHNKVNKFSCIISSFFTCSNILIYLFNSKVRDRNINSQFKVGIVGHFGLNNQFYDGQTVKTKNVYDALCKRYGKNEVLIVDTYNWKKKPLKLLFNCFKAIKKSGNVVILPAKKGVKVFVPLFTKLNMFFKKKLHYVTIGSWIYEVICNDNAMIKSLKKYKGIYVENIHIKEKMLSLGFTNIYVMPNFKNIIPITEREIKKVSKNRIKTCIFSRIMYEKGIEDAIDCVCQVSNSLSSPTILLDIYGPINKEYEARFKSICHQFPKNIRYCGVVDYQETTDVIKEYDIMLFPTHFMTEGIPGTILDAYASGVLVLASRWNNFDEIIDEGCTGIGFEMMNNEDFVNKFKEIISDSDKMYQMKKCALKKYNEYLPDKVIEILIDNF